MKHLFGITKLAEQLKLRVSIDTFPTEFASLHFTIAVFISAHKPQSVFHCIQV